MGDAEKTKDRRQYTQSWDQVGWMLRCRHITTHPPPESLLYTVEKQEQQFLGDGV
jgi:hypothetical protein